ncbi:uncharacterized protein LOC131179161 isoform X2 [Hevea brasiliensis]|uniref:uncharacterized protein LOC131179161 isoform X2 n=1 Tax=Hevea brasiliensis TaxID=3981 RepID=UPI0025E0611D|nr:uncharacterized protein LOC131179161 isoform X2 [Hevea brasiliensis]XP_058001187.1 uncharacterized protein LOC131179161 isoform X2 [Hevea brasiliensis]
MHQSLVLFLYWVLTILFLLRDSIDLFTLNDNFLFVLTGLVFFIDYSAIANGISGIVGGVVYDLCGYLTILCGCCCFYLAVRPSALFMEFCFCCGLVLRGTWILQAGLCLYTDFFSFKGCHKIMVSPECENAELKCDLEEDGLTGVALVNLLFIGHAIGVLLVSFGLFGLLSSHGEASGALLAELQSESTLMRTLPRFELELSDLQVTTRELVLLSC